jgi:hypothetical protein
VGHAQFPKGISSLLLRCKSDLWETQSQPQEESRLNTPREFLVRTLGTLQTHVYGYFCDLVCNLDEMGVSEWEDRKSKKVVIPMNMKDRLIRHKAAGRSII